MEQNRTLQQHIQGQQQIETQLVTKVEQLREQRALFKGLLAKLIIHCLALLRSTRPIASLEKVEDFQAQIDIICAQPSARLRTELPHGDRACQTDQTGDPLALRIQEQDQVLRTLEDKQRRQMQDHKQKS